MVVKVAKYVPTVGLHRNSEANDLKQNRIAKKLYSPKKVHAPPPVRGAENVHHSILGQTISIRHIFGLDGLPNTTVKKQKKNISTNQIYF